MVLLIGIVATLATGSSAGAVASLTSPLVFVQQDTARPARMRLVRLDPDGSLRVLSQGLAAAADPDVSFDGEDLLFAARRRPGDDWQIWRMAADGADRGPLTDLPGAAREPVWLARAAVNAPGFDQRLPWIAFTSTAAGVGDDRGQSPLANLYAMSLEPVPGRGIVHWRTTFDLGGNGAPTVLADGRILYSARQRQGWALMTISWAGENLNPFYGSHDGAWSQWSACELPGDRVLFIESTDAGAGRGGRLASVSWRRPLHSHQVLADDGEYRTPARLADGGVVVAWRGGGLSFGLYRFDVDRRARGELIYDDPAWDEIDAVALAPRTPPQGRIPTVDFASVLDVGGFDAAGQLQCLNVYESDLLPLSTTNPVTAVRLVEGLPRPLGARGPEGPAPPAAAWPPPGVDVRSLGEAPVEVDGSFYVNVAGDVPFYIELLGADGRVAGVMRSWMWVRSGDQRGCIGCHENRELGPPNRATRALRRSQPANLMGPRQGASH